MVKQLTVFFFLMNKDFFIDEECLCLNIGVDHLLIEIISNLKIVCHAEGTVHKMLVNNVKLQK
jgi:hypothetical protein